MKILASGRSAFPESALKYAAPAGEGDQSVIDRSHKLGSMFHGVVELKLQHGTYLALMRTLSQAGWKEESR